MQWRGSMQLKQHGQPVHPLAEPVQPVSMQLHGPRLASRAGWTLVRRSKSTILSMCKGVCLGGSIVVVPPTGVCTNACQNNVCSSQGNPANLCIQLQCGTYACSCAPGWQAGPNGQSCVGKFLVLFFVFHMSLSLVGSGNAVCINPCASGDLCNSNQQGNICVQLQCGRYACSCSAPGWTSANGGLSCTSNPRIVVSLNPICMFV